MLRNFRRHIFCRVRRRVLSSKSFTTDHFGKEYDSAENFSAFDSLENITSYGSPESVISYDSAENISGYESAKSTSRAKNPNSVILHGNIFAIKKDHESDRLRVTLKVCRDAVTKFGDPYIRTEYFNVNFYGVSDPVKNWKIPKYFAVGDTVATYSNLCRSSKSNVMYLKGYAMSRQSNKQATADSNIQTETDDDPTLFDVTDPIEDMPGDVVGETATEGIK